MNNTHETLKNYIERVLKFAGIHREGYYVTHTKKYHSTINLQ